MAGTCLLTYSTALANSSALHIYVLIALQPAQSINVALFQLLEWHKYAMFPVSSGVHAAEEAERCAIQEAAVSFKTSLSFAWPHLCFPLQSAKMFLTSRRHGSTLETAASVLFWVLKTINDFVPQLNGNKVVFIFCIVSRSLNTNFGPRRWNSTFPRRVNKKCQEETCTFKGKATGKGLWVGFCAMAALCQGLLPSPEPPVPKHPKKKMRPFCQSAKLTPLLLLLSGSKSSLCVWICELFLIMYQERLKRTNCINTLTRLTMPYNTDAGTHAKHRK